MQIHKKITSLLDKWQNQPVKKRLIGKELTALLRRSNIAQKQLSILKTASDEEWSVSKANMDYILDELIKGLSDFDTRPH